MSTEIYYSPHSASHPGLEPGKFSRSDVEKMEVERQAFTVGEVARLTSERDAAIESKLKAEKKSRRVQLDRAAQAQAAKLKENAASRYPGSAQEFEAAWENGMRERVFEAAMLTDMTGQTSSERAAAAYVRSRF